MDQFGLVPPAPIEPRYNISPTQSVPVIRRNRDGVSEFDTLRWGLIPSWSKDPAIGNRMINARAETVSEKPAFRAAFTRRRCLVLASGFYEWGQTPSGKWPFFIAAADQKIMAFAGLWELWQPADGQTIESCVIITTAASPFLAEVHERMPAILPADAQTLWLTAETAPQDCLRILRSADGERLEKKRVERAVNNPSNEGAELLSPAAAD